MIGAIEGVFIPVGIHRQATLTAMAQNIMAPAGVGAQPTHIWIQAIGGNVRFCLPGSTATTTLGFRLAANVAFNDDKVIPCPQGTLSVCGEIGGEILEYQWLMMYPGA